MKLKHSNLKVLEKRFPEVLRRIELSAKNPSSTPTMRPQWNPNFQITIGEKKYHPYGKEAEASLLQLWVDSLELNEETLYGVTGFGDGSHLRALLEQSPSSSYFFVCEKDPAYLGQLFAARDYSALLANKRLILATGEPDQNFFKIMGDISFSEIKHAYPLIYAPLYSLDEPYYSHSLTSLAQAIEVYKLNYQTNVRASGYHLEVLVQNLPQLIQAPDIALTKNCFQGAPLILVGAGPSLDESIDFLKQTQGKAVIVSVNSSYRKLLNSNLKPTITAAADPRIFTFRGYENLDTEDVFLFCPFFVNPHIVQKFSGNIFTWSLNQQLVTSMRQRLRLPPPTPIIELGTVSSCVLDLARHWGCNKICLVGQDFAVSSTGQTHTEDSFYTDSGANHIDLEKCRKYPGNTLPEVSVENRLFTYLKSFERLVEDMPSIQFINTSRTGAKIKGIPYKTYDAALQWLTEDNKAIDTHQVLTELIETHKHTQNFTNQDYEKAIEPSLKFAHELLTKATEAAHFLEQLPERYQKQNFSNHKDVAKALAYSDSINRYIDKHKQDYQIFFDGEGKKYLIQFAEAKRKIAHPQPHWEAILQNKEFFWALAEGAYFMMTRLKYLETTWKASEVKVQF